METTSQLKIESVERFSGDIAKVRDELDSAGLGQDVFVVCQTEAEAERLGDVFSTNASRRNRATCTFRSARFTLAFVW